MDKFNKLMKKKKGSEMSDMEKNAKMGVLGELRDMASGAMGDKLHNLKKVSVMSDSKEGLEKGLEKAQDIVDQAPLHEGSEEAEEMVEEGAEMPQPGMEGHEESEMMSVEEMKKELARLQAALAKFEAGHEEME